MYKIDSLDHYGRGIIKNDKIIFIDNALPNEIVDVKVNKENKKYIEANVSKYLKKSNDRVSVKCPYYDECGGCNIMHLSFDNQLKFKQDKINNIVNRYLKDNIKVNEIIKSDDVLNYRNKVEFQVKENGLCGRSLEEAIKNVNRTHYGLTGSITETDLEFTDKSKTDFALNLVCDNPEYVIPKYIKDGFWQKF